MYHTLYALAIRMVLILDIFSGPLPSTLHFQKNEKNVKILSKIITKYELLPNKIIFDTF